MMDSSFPKMFRLRQTFHGPRVGDIAAEVESQLATLDLGAKIKAHETVAVCAGSRGISNVKEITKAVVDHLKQLGAKPYIVPAMGSHGGATVDGQLEVLKTYGITESYCGCEIRATMDTVVVCQSDEGVDIHFDRNAYEADHVVVCNRVKLHTDFTGEIQSGLMKMMLIGLGKHVGASLYHRAFREYSFDQIARSVSNTVITECNVVGCLAIVENGYEQTAMIQAVRPDEIGPKEHELLQMSKQWMARLPFDKIDVLIIDEIGKNISGTGMDTNVVGRKHDENRAIEDEFPQIQKIVVRSLTEETHGNATGIGLADFTTQQVLDQLDYSMTRVNCVTSGRTAVAAIPIHFPTDQEALGAALKTCGLTPPPDARVLHIKNTLELVEVECSQAFLADAEARSDLKVMTELRAMLFDASGQLAAIDDRVC